MDKTFLIFSNHQSGFEPVVLVCDSMFSGKHITGMAKRSIENVSIGTVYLSKIRIIYLDRENIRDAMLAFKTAIKYADEGQPIFIFPEGTRSKAKEMLPFKMGAFKLAFKTKLPIYLTVFKNFHTYRFMHWDNENSSIKIIGPIKYDEYRHMNMEQLHDYIREIFKKELEIERN